MRTRVVPILAAVALTGCASQVDKDLEAVKAARSVLAEWALVEAQAATDRAPATYLAQMRHLARDQLGTARSTLAHRPAAVRAIDLATRGPPEPAVLARARAALEPLERSLESS